MSRTRDHRGISSGSQAYFDVSDFCVIRFYNFLATPVPFIAARRRRRRRASIASHPLVRELVFRRRVTRLLRAQPRRKRGANDEPGTRMMTTRDSSVRYHDEKLALPAALAFFATNAADPRWSRRCARIQLGFHLDAPSLPFRAAHFN